jgi:hypothetical protein
MALDSLSELVGSILKAEHERLLEHIWLCVL